MPVIRGNDVLTINGLPVAKQGVAPLRPGISPDQAALATKNNGLDELILAVRTPEGKRQRVVVYGRELDLSFRNQSGEPDIQLNGAPAMLLHFDDEMSTFTQRVVRGTAVGIKEAMDVLAAMARRSIEGAGYAGAAAFLGGTIWVVASGGAALEVIKSAAIVLAPKIAVGIGSTALVGMGLIVVAAALKALLGGAPDPRMETIAAIIDDQGERGSNEASPPAAPYLPGVPLPSVPMMPQPGLPQQPGFQADDGGRSLRRPGGLPVTPREEPSLTDGGLGDRAQELLANPRVRDSLNRLPFRVRNGA
ncbi:MAG: hypothetical protein VKP62_04430 [Candidatus Sericytochromatia bacterium]|nr:hypothetical protein [Candidatus Sericytochromatia bacterium]